MNWASLAASVASIEAAQNGIGHGCSPHGLQRRMSAEFLSLSKTVLHGNTAPGSRETQFLRI